MSNEERLKYIGEVLSKKGASCPCMACKGENFTLIDGFLVTVVTETDGRVIINIPTVVIVCDNCGYVSQHSSNILDIPPKEEISDSDKKNENVRNL